MSWAKFDVEKIREEIKMYLELFSDNKGLICVYDSLMGKTFDKIANSRNFSKSSVEKYIQRYKRTLKVIDFIQPSEFGNYVVENIIPLEEGFPYEAWTTETLQEYIYIRFEVKISKRTCASCIKRMDKRRILLNLYSFMSEEEKEINVYYLDYCVVSKQTRDDRYLYLTPSYSIYNIVLIDKEGNIIQTEKIKAFENKDFFKNDMEEGNDINKTTFRIFHYEYVSTAIRYIRELSNRGRESIIFLENNKYNQYVCTIIKKERFDNVKVMIVNELLKYKEDIETNESFMHSVSNNKLEDYYLEYDEMKKYIKSKVVKMR